MDYLVHVLLSAKTKKSPKIENHGTQNNAAETQVA
jgi:hypothetical protein